MEVKKKNIGVLYGGIAGLFMIVFMTVLYLGGLKLYLSWIARLGYIVIFGLAVTATLVQKKANGGWLDFQHAVKISFSVMALALAAHTLFTWVLLNFIDTHFKATLAQAVFEKTEALIRRMPISTDSMEKAIADERGKDEFSFSSMSLGFAIYCIPQFIVALLIAAIVRKKKIDTNGAGS
jgi:uncharacterized protein DUF4199